MPSEGVNDFSYSTCGFPRDRAGLERPETLPRRGSPTCQGSLSLPDAHAEPVPAGAYRTDLMEFVRHTRIV